VPTVTHSIKIPAPVERVFHVVTTPDNWTRYVTSLVEVSNQSPDLPAEGSTFSWKYRMMGFTFGGRGVVTTCKSAQNFAMTLQSKFPIKESYEFKDLGAEGTELTVTIDYEIPSAMKTLFEGSGVMEKMNQIEARSVLEKISALCEV